MSKLYVVNHACFHFRPSRNQIQDTVSGCRINSCICHGQSKRSFSAPARIPRQEACARRWIGSRPMFPIRACPKKRVPGGRGGCTLFLNTFRAMEMRPASQEGRAPTGKRPGLIGMSGAMVFKNSVQPPRPPGTRFLGQALIGNMGRLSIHLLAHASWRGILAGGGKAPRLHLVYGDYLKRAK